MARHHNKHPGGRPLKSGEPRRQVAFRLPVSAADKLASLADRLGVSQADVLADAIASYSSDRPQRL